MFFNKLIQYLYYEYYNSYLNPNTYFINKKYNLILLFINTYNKNIYISELHDILTNDLYIYDKFTFINIIFECLSKISLYEENFCKELYDFIIDPFFSIIL